MFQRRYKRTHHRDDPTGTDHRQHRRTRHSQNRNRGRPLTSTLGSFEVQYSATASRGDRYTTKILVQARSLTLTTLCSTREKAKHQRQTLSAWRAPPYSEGSADIIVSSIKFESIQAILTESWVKFLDLEFLPGSPPHLSTHY